MVSDASQRRLCLERSTTAAVSWHLFFIVNGCRQPIDPAFVKHCRLREVWRGCRMLTEFRSMRSDKRDGGALRHEEHRSGVSRAESAEKDVPCCSRLGY